MSLRPRWNDDFSTDPFLDPAYTITSGATGWTYNGTTDRLENSSSGNVNATLELADSAHQTGIVEADLGYFYSTGSDNTSMALRAFGYSLVTGEQLGSKFVGIYPEELDTLALISEFGNSSISHFAGNLTGPFTFRIVGTPVSVDFYIDGMLKFTAPARAVNGNVKVSFRRSGGGSGGTSFLSRFLVKTDASLPKAITINTPGLSGGLAAASGPVIVQVPDSRLYLDLGAFAGRIGPSGLTNVVYDPGGANVSMSEDTGIPDGSGGTVGDYYLECPIRGVSSDNRLVIKEDFVTANSVVVTDTIDFDIVGGPTGQSGSVVEEDDLHCYVEKHTTLVNNQDQDSMIYPNVGNLSLHNINADGNDAFTNENGPRSRMINSAGTGQINGIGRFSMSGMSFPILFDIDLGRIRKLKKIAIVNFSGEFNLTFRNCIGFDIYSNTEPFSGPSLLQGTLEKDNYYAFVNTAILSSPANLDKDYWTALEEFNEGDLDVTTRYLRLVVNLDNTVGTGSTFVIFGRQFLFFEQTEIGSINSFDDNAQFEFSNGGPYGAFPIGGVTQGVGTVRITLPTSIQHDGTSPNYYKVYFIPDITD